MRKNNNKLRQSLCGFLSVGVLVLGGAGAVNAQASSQTYKTAGRDPFKKYKPPVRRVVAKKVVAPVAQPDIKVRIAQYKAKKLAAMNMQQPAPKPTTAILLGEIQVTGIFRTPRGYAAMVEATPINLSYVIYPGEKFYDGMLVAIEETRLVFRHETLWTDGHRVVAVDTMPLRQPDAVADSMTEAKPAQSAKRTSDSSDKEEKASEAKKP
ncbi:MAG: hypothetical protein LC754_02665 [Acidobacteria bacterium]|nr:hypothetical protein [Acidobacteriota bacterium]